MAVPTAAAPLKLTGAGAQRQSAAASVKKEAVGIITARKRGRSLGCCGKVRQR